MSDAVESSDNNQRKNRIVKAPLESEEPETNEEPAKMSIRQEIEKKREDKIKKEEANYTYKPQLVTKKFNGQGAGKDENRFDKLYSDALKRHIEGTWKEDPQEKEMTFTPKITKRASRSSSRNSSRNSSRENSLDRSTTSIHDRLNSSSGSPRKKALSTNVEENLTFQPKISKRAKSIERQTLKDAAERLYLHSQFVKEKAEKKKQAADQIEKEKYTFQPSLVPSKHNTTSRKDLVERMQDFETEKNKRLAVAMQQKQQQEQEQITLKPALIAKKRSSTPTPDNGTIFERLATTNHKSEKYDPELTFKPKLSTKRAPSPDARGEGNDVYERLFNEGQQRKREAAIEMQQKREASEAELTFKPQIITKYKKPATYNAETGELESVDDDKEMITTIKTKEAAPVFKRFEQDANDWKAMRNTLDSIKADMELKECTFAPKLSASTTALASKREDSSLSLYDRQLQERERTNEYIRKQQEEKEKQELTELTFQPHLPKSSVGLAKKRSTPNLIVDTDTATETSTNVYQRLAASPLSRSQSMQYGDFSNTNTNNNHIHLHNNPDSVRRSVILSQNDLDKVFERLNATPKGDAVPTLDITPKKVVVPAKDLDSIVTRLNTTVTQSFSFRVDPEKGADETIAALRKESIKLQPNQLNQTFERVLTPTTASSHNLHALARRDSFSNNTSGNSSPHSPTLRRKSSRLSASGSTNNLLPHSPSKYGLDAVFEPMHQEEDDHHEVEQPAVELSPPRQSSEPTTTTTNNNKTSLATKGRVPSNNSMASNGQQQPTKTTTATKTPVKTNGTTSTNTAAGKTKTPTKSPVKTTTTTTAAKRASTGGKGANNPATSVHIPAAPVVIRKKKTTTEPPIPPLSPEIKKFIDEIPQVEETGSDEEN